MDLSERKEMIHDYIVTKRVGEQNAGLIPELLDLMLTLLSNIRVQARHNFKVFTPHSILT